MRFESMTINDDGTYVFTEYEHEGGRTATINLTNDMITGVSGKRLKSIPSYYKDMCALAFPHVSLDTFRALLKKGYGTCNDVFYTLYMVDENNQDEIESLAKILIHHYREGGRYRLAAELRTINRMLEMAKIISRTNNLTRNEKMTLANDRETWGYFTRATWEFARYCNQYPVNLKIQNRLHGNVSDTTKEFVKILLNEVSNLTDEEMDAIFAGAQHGMFDNLAYVTRYDDFSPSNLPAFGESEITNTAKTMVKSYIEACRFVKETPSFSGNFINKYAAVLRECHNRKNEAFKNYQEYRNLHFEDDNFIVIVPLTVDELIKEGKTQHNCVGTWGYDREIVNRNKNIVFVREKANPETSYITCEIYEDGGIGQYLYAYNEDVSDNDPAMAFCEKYKEYLRSIW